MYELTRQPRCLPQITPLRDPACPIICSHSLSVSPFTLTILPSCPYLILPQPSRISLSFSQSKPRLIPTRPIHPRSSSILFYPPLSSFIYHSFFGKKSPRRVRSFSHRPHAISTLPFAPSTDNDGNKAHATVSRALKKFPQRIAQTAAVLEY
jgi:hypothetical protein